ncbi:MAG: hypothetical protein N4A33_10335 [Bacteriovoracaceae bacterium]|jgi:hypothetical protein|nr:hypothetical protein [Bacteriovoracaceae bacterium]
MKLLLALLLVVSFSSMAQKGGGDDSQTSQTQYDDFGDGSDEFDFNRFSNENVLAMIDRDMEFACNRAGLCTIHSVTSNDRRFTASFSFGEGFNNNQFGGNGGGTVVVAGGGAQNCLNCPRDYWGVNLEFTAGRCTQTVNVPRSLYISMNRYMYDLMDEDGNTRRGFDPAKEAMIMFYTTIMKEAKGCTAPK